jgi:hypothetical protein
VRPGGPKIDGSDLQIDDLRTSLVERTGRRYLPDALPI